MDNPSLDAVLAALPLPALAVDRSERVIAANAEARALLGQGLVGRHFTILLRQPPVIEAIETCLGTGNEHRARYLGNDGAQDTTFDLVCRFMPGLGRGGGAALLSFHDVTQMQQAGQMRRDFVANVSHELRTPLTALMGFIETLRGPARADAAARDRFLQIMQDEAERMNRLVGDLLSLNRVEGEERVRPRAPVDLGAQVTATTDTLAPLARDAGVQLELDLPAAPVVVPGDPDQLRQVLTNLVENAIKYGGAGGRVRLALTTVDRDPSLRGPAAWLSVTDFGPGIDPRHLPRLTERFYRADSHRSRQMGGTGLGLAIVKHIVNRHRGRLKITSNLGQGSVFTVIIPLTLDR